MPEPRVEDTAEFQQAVADAGSQTIVATEDAGPPPAPDVVVPVAVGAKIASVAVSLPRTPPAPMAVDANTRPPHTPDVSTSRSLVNFAAKAVKIAALVASAWFMAVVLLLAVYRYIDPPISALMIQQRLSGQDIIQDWVSLDDIAPPVVRAVLLSEDGRFCEHNGIDFEAVQDAIEHAGDGTPRGASTISMQVVKNPFLWPSKSYVRKAIEVPLTYLMELLWPKRRIMEVYLNIAEWGPGIFGVEAASQFHFNKAAARLSDREAARLAVALPNPLLRDAGDPGPRTQRLAGDIQGRMRAAAASQTACVLSR